MTLMDYCMQYIGEIMDGKRAAPEGVTLTETDPMRRSLELMQKAGDIPTLVRMCAAQDGTEIPQEVFDSFDPESLTQLAREGDAAPEEPEQQPDPDAGKHAFQVLLDCVALDDGLVQYLTQVLRDRNWAGFYKLSQITTKMDLDPEEFLFWLGNKELWADDEERVCAAVMDACLERLRRQELSRDIGAYKAAHGLPVRDPEREAQVLRSRGDLAPEHRAEVERLYETLMALSREQQS